VQRVRLHYAKRGRLRFSSHRDFQRAFERALRRAAVPMAYSAGFSPHPKVSYAGAAPTGVASEAEYLEIALSERCDPERLRAALDRSLPPGLDVLDVVEVAGGSLAERLEASVWEIKLPGVLPSRATEAVAAFLAAPRVEVSRLTKNGTRTFDARAAVLGLTVLERDEPVDGAPCAILRMVVQHVTPAVRPDDVLVGLRQTGDLEPPVTPAVTRLAQGPRDERSDALCGLEVSDPLAPDRKGPAA
jgi:radical SAM-linked protein